VRTSSIKSVFTDSSVRPTRRARAATDSGAFLADDPEQMQALFGQQFARVAALTPRLVPVAPTVP
jgi:hypothetical protein